MITNFHCEICGYKGKSLYKSRAMEVALAHKAGQHNVRVFWTVRKSKKERIMRKRLEAGK